MSEHNQLLCNWSKPHLRTELCSYNLSLSPLWADDSYAVNCREQTSNPQGKSNINNYDSRKTKTIMSYKIKIVLLQKNSVHLSSFQFSLSCQIVNRILSPVSHGNMRCSLNLNIVLIIQRLSKHIKSLCNFES